MSHTLRRSTLALLSGISVVVAVAACGNADAASEDSAQTATQQDSTADAGTDASAGTDATDDAGTDTSADSGTTYADGTYTAEGAYSSPGGQEAIEVEITVADDVVTAVTVTPEATAGNAARFQKEFASGIADVVVGEELAGLSVDKVSGSSLTGDGFNTALDQIRADAEA
ncbi:MAG TPA: hypothetical protein VGC57_12045 [Cellulomonas sp.]